MGTEDQPKHQIDHPWPGSDDRGLLHDPPWKWSEEEYILYMQNTATHVLPDVARNGTVLGRNFFPFKNLVCLWKNGGHDCKFIKVEFFNFFSVFKVFDRQPTPFNLHPGWERSVHVSRPASGTDEILSYSRPSSTRIY